jgi:hypothetical protein
VIYSKLYASLLATAFVLLAPSALLAQRNIHTERVRFEQGATSAVVERSITGYEIVDYVLSARKGQYMNVSMATDNSGNYFNILAPGENEVAMFNSSMGTNQYEGVLSESGDYKIRVYLMRSAARRNEVANYRLEMIVTKPGDRSSTSNRRPTGDALVEGTSYNATGKIPCAMTRSQPTSSCSFGVTRQGNGSGTVTITKPDGGTRVIFFENGKATGYDVRQGDSGKFSASRQGDLTIVRIGQERYELPDAVIFGG